jgi:signal transduction histidine kinase
LASLTRDVVARRRIEADLVDALKARDDLVAVAAHELRNPLNVFHLTLQLLYRLSGEGASAVDLRRLLDRSRIQLSRLSALVDRLLDVTRLRSGKFELDREEFDLGELAREVVVRQREESPAADVSFDTEEGVIGNWDRLRLDQAVTNLVSNAIKYGCGRPVMVRISTCDNLAIVTVRDHGVGMPPADLARIFDRFERAVPRTNNEGLGLGLWITKRIAEAHDGSVLVESQLGHGSTFTLRLPRQIPRL